MCFLVALSITKNRALEKKITYTSKIEFSKLNLSRTLMKTKGKRNLKGKQNCIYLLYFAMQNDWFFTAYTYNTCLLAIWPRCKFEIRAALKKSEADWLRGYLLLNCIEMITFPEFLIFSSPTKECFNNMKGLEFLSFSSYPLFSMPLTK